MKERPILFSAPMVLALLAGTKTQTRRAVKPQPPAGHNFAGFTTHSTCSADEGKAVWGAGDVSALLHDVHRVRCPYGNPGDRLWVRETLRLHRHAGTRGGWLYAADNTHVELAKDDPRVSEMISWGHHKDGETCVSIHMPRWASRLTLEITDVRAQRLQGISESDACAEGCGSPITRDCKRPKFAALWDSINGAGAWDANPWVWAITFARTTP